MKRSMSYALKALAIALLIVVVAAAARVSRIPMTPKIALLSLLGLTVAAPAEAALQGQLRAAPGYELTQFATGLGRVRMLAMASSGDVLVSRPGRGDVLLLRRDANGDGRHDGDTVLLSQLDQPHGLALHDGWLYVAESGRVGRVRFNPGEVRVEGDYQVLINGLPEGGNHRSKSIHIRGDELFLSIGSSCNVCVESDPRRAAVLRFNLDGSGGRVFASGLRNSVGLDTAPWSGDLYATDNGRDLLGDDYPVCELNRLVDGGFYGWPYFNGFGDRDPDLGGRLPSQFPPPIDPVFGFRAHNAPLGIHFLRFSRPDVYRRAALVALHGSWNRSEPDGYKVVAVHWGEDGTVTASDFLTGFERGGKVIGRPVDITEDENGCVYVSDDHAGSIYRLCYRGGE